MRLNIPPSKIRNYEKIFYKITGDTDAASPVAFMLSFLDPGHKRGSG